MMSFANITILKFIKEILDYEEVDDILDICQTQSEKGFVFERLFDLMIKFGFCNHFPNSTYNHLIGNSNNGIMKTLKNLNQYVEKNYVIAGNSGGCSDISLQNKENQEYIFISSKYPKSTDDIKREKSIDYYDIQNIIAMAVQNKNIYHKYHIYLVVPDKNKLLDKVQKSKKSSQYITNHITDLQKYFMKFRDNMIKSNNYKNYKKWNEIYLSTKKSLSLRFHQKLIVDKTLSLIDKGKKSFLWGCKCRSGKTYMVGGLIKQASLKAMLETLKKYIMQS